MKKQVLDRFNRQNYFWTINQDKKKRLIKTAVASSIATALIVSRLMTQVYAADEKIGISEYKNDNAVIFAISDSDDITDETTDGLTDETTDGITDGVTDGITDEVKDGITDTYTDENTDGISDYNSYDFSDEISDEWNTDERAVLIGPNGQNIALFRLDKNILFMNNKKFKLDSPPTIYNERTLLPVKYIASSMGADVGWDPVDKKITITQADKTIELWIDSSNARVNGVTTQIDPDDSSVQPKIIKGRTMVPVKFVSENLGANVFWDQSTKTISVKF